MPSPSLSANAALAHVMNTRYIDAPKLVLICVLLEAKLHYMLLNWCIIAVLVGISLFKWLYIRTSTFEDCLFCQFHLTVIFFLSLSVERELLGNLEQCIGHMAHCLNRDPQRLVLGYPLYCTWKGVQVLYGTWTLWTSDNHTPRWLNSGLPPPIPKFGVRKIRMAFGESNAMFRFRDRCFVWSHSQTFTPNDET